MSQGEIAYTWALLIELGWKSRWACGGGCAGCFPFFGLVVVQACSVTLVHSLRMMFISACVRACLRACIARP
eukprot:209293-Pelagomonas_calceolata.AAC.3